MNEQPKLHLLLEMLLYLSSGLRYKIEEIAERFDISVRTAYRYINTFTNYFAIWAYDVNANCCKTFKNTRIKAVRILSQPWKNEAKHKKLPIDVFRISSNRQIKVTLKLSIRACELLKEEYPLAEEYIQPLNDKEYLFTAPVCSFEGAGRFVMGLHNEIEVIEPEEFKKFLKKRAKKIMTDTG